jgi:hypothetical protein
MAQTAPTCASPSFIIGIPKCTTIAQNIFSVSVKGSQAGQSTLAFADLKIIGAGSNVSSVWYCGSYNITVIDQIAPVVAQQPTETVTPTEEVIPVETQEVQTPAEQTSPENNIPTGVGAASFASVAAPYFWPLLIILIVLVVGYGAYYFIKGKKK